MFERYTERARRALFFARYEASQLGSISIETEHLLLGVLREGQGVTGRIFGRAHVSFDRIRREIEERVNFHERSRRRSKSPSAPKPSACWDRRGRGRPARRHCSAAALLRESLQEQFGVNVIRDDAGDPPTLAVILR
jgi:ATP-dependent Clp protease ATP-binding subunit ClpC